MEVNTLPGLRKEIQIHKSVLGVFFGLKLNFKKALIKGIIFNLRYETYLIICKSLLLNYSN